MRLGSESAYRTALEGWDSLLADGGVDEVASAREIFGVADLLDAQPTLLAVLEDSVRSADDRAQLVRQVFGSKVSGPVADLLAGLARGDWSEQGDLKVALERLGVQTLLAGAGRMGKLEEVEDEIYDARGLLAKQRDLRLTLADQKFELPARERLVEKVFAGETPYGVELVKRAVAKVESRPIASTLSDYLEAAADRGSHLVASVTAALPLTSEQEQRLVAVLSRKYGKDVKLHTTIDTAVIGGLRVHIGSDVIDGTLATRLAQVKEQLSNGR